MIIAALILFAVTLAFVVAELFLPSHGILSICAAVFAIAAVVMMYRANEMAGILSAILVVLAAPFVLYAAIKIYPRTAMGKRVMLAGPDDATATPFHAESSKLQELVGQRGITMTTLRPAGAVEIAGRRIDCISESHVIDPNTPVEVLQVIGLKVIVKAIDAA